MNCEGYYLGIYSPITYRLVKYIVKCNLKNRTASFFSNFSSVICSSNIFSIITMVVAILLWLYLWLYFVNSTMKDFLTFKKHS